jgi:uncharacterized protein
MNAKLEQLEALLKGYGSAAVAYSGGVDSTFLFAVAHRVLGDRALGVIGRSPTYPKRELEDAIRMATEMGAKFEVVDTCEMDNPDFASNPSNRCFFCKSNLFEVVGGVAEKHGIRVILEGSNADDTGDYRPGMEAARKLGVKTPLLEAGLTKDEIRALSKEMGLETWNKPAMACLSSRIPYGETITLKRLSRIEATEMNIRNLGYRQLRVRDHGDVARIEVEPTLIAEVATVEARAAIVSVAKAAGYKFVCLDLEGYRTGAMNEVLDPPVRAAKPRTHASE